MRVSVTFGTVAVILLVLLTACAGRAASKLHDGMTPTGVPQGTVEGQSRTIILATTTSGQDSGLLDALLPRFQEETGYVVKVIAVGTGQALELGRRGEADALLVHAPEAEEQFVAEGYGQLRFLVATNDFVIVGLADDPAHVREASSAVDALRRIAATGAIWVSRDDRSGTGLLEKRLWQEAGIDPHDQSWYITSGQGMGMTLVLADQKRAYTLSDRATFLAFRSSISLVILAAGDPALINPYHVITVNPTRFALCQLTRRRGVRSLPCVPGGSAGDRLIRL